MSTIMSTSTPPPLPPKSPSLAPSTRTNRSTTAFSSYTTENPASPARPTHAQRGTRTQASSVHLSFSGPLGALEGPQMDPSGPYDAQDDDDLASEGELANLPWAEPPPRDPSPYPSLLRQPSLSFLASDPNQQQISNDTVSRRSSRSSIGSRRSQSHLSPAYLPNANLSPALDTHRFSAQTVHSFQSGMADMEVESQSHSVEQLGPTPPRTRDDSPRSAMAVRAESALSNRSDRSIKSALKAKARSLKSTASSRKRNSNSTIHRRSFQKRYGKWEVEMSPLLEEDARRREEQLELSALLGRATVLERMLKAGRRASRPTTPISSLKRFASKSTKSSAHPSPLETPRTNRSSSLRYPFSRRNRREDQFTEIGSQSNLGSATAENAPLDQDQPEKEKKWVVLIPEKTVRIPVEDDISPQPTCVSFPSCTSEKRPPVEEEAVDRRLFIQSPHLGHRSPDHHHRQSVLSYISVGKWSSSTRGGRRRRKLVLGISIGCVIGVILLTGLLAGLLARRSE